ncbi:hypothetical protein CBI38_00600 [Rhodococcus oxybenzonivorans]|uniref:Uncharacterized protein n=1 Tax=Rhodococcus oxybenzonivorans TaxID=1990687 RepID=A0A2S2BP07_9NOCA|nr:hypothetical protein CBI38_00600 [Rhodococcus oxybenzonivorans]
MVNGVSARWVTCIARKVQALFTARAAIAVSFGVDTSQPTIVPANPSMANAVYAKPDTIRTYVRSTT